MADTTVGVQDARGQGRTRSAAVLLEPPSCSRCGKRVCAAHRRERRWCALRGARLGRRLLGHETSSRSVEYWAAAARKGVWLQRVVHRCTRCLISCSGLSQQWRTFASHLPATVDLLGLRATSVARHGQAKPMRMRSRHPLRQRDWCDDAGTLGLPTWADGPRPCYKCNVSRSELADHASVTVHSAPIGDHVSGDYELACQRCEVLVDCSASTHARTFSVQKGCITTGATMAAEDGLCKRGWLTFRSKHTIDLSLARHRPDVGATDSVTQIPLHTAWWRPSMKISTRHRNPLLDPRLGLDPVQCLTADMLHAMFLGVMNNFCRRSLWFLLQGGAWGLMSTQEETIQVGMQVVQHNITEEVQTSALHGPHRAPYQSQVDQEQKLALRATPQLKAKGAETYGACIWLVEQLAVRSQRGTEASALREASAELLRMVGLWRPYGWVVPGEVVEEAMRTQQPSLATKSFANMACPSGTTSSA